MKKLIILILIITFLIRIYNLNYNSPFLDEALYIVLGQKILAGNIAEGIEAISWVGGFPFIYPPLTAALYSIGGIEASRSLNVLLITFCIYLLYIFTRQLKLFPKKRSNELAGIFAAAIAAFSAAFITVSRLAIYDALSFTLFLLALVLLQKAIYKGESKYYLVTSIILFLSFLSKYITAIYIPFLLLMPLILAIKSKSAFKIQGVLKSFAFPLISLLGIYTYFNYASLVNFLQYNASAGKPPLQEILNIFIEYTFIAYLLAFIGTVFLWRSRNILLVILFFFSFIPLTAHTLTGNSDSMQQHTFLTLIFIFPIIGGLFIIAFQKNKAIGIIFFIFTILGQLAYSIPKVQESQSFWPNSNKAIEYLNQNLNSEDRILAESGDIIVLGLKNKLDPEKLTGPFVFSYMGLEKRPAYIQAIEDDYFRFIQLERTYFSENDLTAIENAIIGRYKKVFDDGKITIYERII